MKTLRKCLLVIALTAMGMAGAGVNVFESVRANREATPSADPNAEFWRGVAGVAMVNDRMGQPVPGYRTEIRSRWTPDNLYFLFICPYETLSLKPDPDTKNETNRLWNWDVAEAFIGGDPENIRRYREFEVSPHGEWVDLAIDRSKPGQGDGAAWNSGFQVTARIDEQKHIWYAEMKIPWKSLFYEETRTAQAGTEVRANFFLNEGPPGNQKSVTWQPTNNEKSFHVPEAFGFVRLR
jgi:hypothetical protein